MIFDLQGHKKSAVKAVYLLLAILMGGGLVLFGIGGQVSGGLVDAVQGTRNADPSGQIEDRITTSEKRLKANPNNAQALEDLIRARYQLATSDNTNGTFTSEGKQQLQLAANRWNQYVDVQAKAKKKPERSIVVLMLQAYGDAGLNQTVEAAKTAELLTELDPTASSYYQLAYYAAQAGQSRRSKLAGEKALELSPKSERKDLKEQLDALQATATPPQSAPAP